MRHTQHQLTMIFIHVGILILTSFHIAFVKTRVLKIQNATLKYAPNCLTNPKINKRRYSFLLTLCVIITPLLIITFNLCILIMALIGCKVSPTNCLWLLDPFNITQEMYMSIIKWLFTPNEYLTIEFCWW